MTEYSSKTLRAAMKAKAARLASGSDATKIGASDFTPAEALNADIQTGARPLTRRRFKSGGKVVGAANAPRADKKKRGNADLSADSFINRNVVEANEEREGKKHIGAFKKGGRAKYANEGTVKGKKTPVRDPYEGEISTRSVTGPGGRYITSEEIRTGIDPSMMPPTMPDDIRASRNAEAAASANANMGKKRGGKADANCSSGRAKKFMGGPMMQPGGSMQPMGGMMKPEPNKDNPADMVEKNRFNFGSGAQGSPYKKGGKVAFEGSAKDTMQDTKLAKKYGMSMAAWEKSKQDKQHDEQESTAGLKKGGRAARASGGKTGKGKTNIEIVIATGRGQPQGGMMPNNGGMPPKQPPAMPVQAAPAAGMPPMAGAGAPPPQMPAGGPPQMPAGLEKLMQRKAGGRVYKSYKDMDAGSGSGLGRLEKTEIAKRTAHKHGGKTYKSYKDMDAGAASGMGRLEKTEIAARGR